MFESLSDRLGRVLGKIRGGGRITESDLDGALREIRVALLEADVAFKVVRDFLAKVRERALGQDVLKSLTPGQQVVGIVNEELVELLGGKGPAAPIKFAGTPPSVFMMIGLQGAGKTTTAGKLAQWLTKQGRHPLIAPVDLQRPAAVLQAVQVAKLAGVSAFEHDGTGTPVSRSKDAIAFAKQKGFDVVLLDTAGRLAIDEELMAELNEIKSATQPDEVLYVADAMTGQDAVRSAQTFNEQVGLSGVVLTKLDGDARGGAALSIRAVTGVPLRFAGVSEKPDGLEVFDATRMAGRILGMGDVVGLVERAQDAFDVDQAEKLEKSLRKNQFTLEQFRDTLKQMRKMGPLDQLMGMMPGVKIPKGAEVDSKQLVRLEAIINSMTNAERRDHRLLNGSRRKRIAKGSGTSVQDVNRLIKQFNDMKKMMKKLGGARGKRGLKGMFAR